jgi:hypothetical protein
MFLKQNQFRRASDPLSLALKVEDEGMKSTKHWEQKD